MADPGFKRRMDLSLITMKISAQIMENGVFIMKSVSDELHGLLARPGSTFVILSRWC